MRGSRRAVAVLAGAVALAAPGLGIAASAPRLSAAEERFARAYEALVPTLNSTSNAVVRAYGDASRYTDAQVAVVFGGLASRWTRVTRPLLALRAPAAESALWRAVTTRVPLVEADLAAIAKAGRTHSASLGRSAGASLERDFNGLGVAVRRLRRRLGLLR